MNKLFESFERLDVVRNRNIEGTAQNLIRKTRSFQADDQKGGPP